MASRRCADSALQACPSWRRRRLAALERFADARTDGRHVGLEEVGDLHGGLFRGGTLAGCERCYGESGYAAASTVSGIRSVQHWTAGFGYHHVQARTCLVQPSQHIQSFSFVPWRRRLALQDPSASLAALSPMLPPISGRGVCPPHELRLTLHWSPCTRSAPCCALRTVH